MSAEKQSAVYPTNISDSPIIIFHQLLQAKKITERHVPAAVAASLIYKSAPKTMQNSLLGHAKCFKMYTATYRINIKLLNIIIVQYLSKTNCSKNYN